MVANMSVKSKWFKRVAWSYVPCSAAGFLFLFTVVASYLAFLGATLFLTDVISESLLLLTRVAGFAVALLVTLIVARRNS